MRDQKIISIDMGTSKIKVIKYKHHDFYYEIYDRDDMDDIVERAVEKDYDVILLTGSGASTITGEDYDIDNVPIPIIRYNELECVANIVKAEGQEEGLVVNIGTGTSFLYYNKGEFQHVTGTGIGGGTFKGLSERLLGVNDFQEVEELALEGEIEKINLVIKDIYAENLGWLQEDITVSNFAKVGTVKEDMALGIHSLVIEPILSMVKGIYQFKPVDNIYFTGGVMNNIILQQLVDKYAKFFDFDYKLLERPSYGTAIGAMMVYWRNNK